MVSRQSGYGQWCSRHIADPGGRPQPIACFAPGKALCSRQRRCINEEQEYLSNYKEDPAIMAGSLEVVSRDSAGDGIVYLPRFGTTRKMSIGTEGPLRWLASVAKKSQCHAVRSSRLSIVSKMMIPANGNLEHPIEEVAVRTVGHLRPASPIPSHDAPKSRRMVWEPS